MVRILVIFLLLLVSVGIFGREKSRPTMQNSEIILGETHLKALVADTDELRARGLSGVSSLSSNEAMIFLFPLPASQIFWMKDMMIPIDIIWVRSGHVIGREENVPPPLPGTPLQDMKRYNSPGDVDMVVETAAGFARRAGLKIGDAVVFHRGK